MSVDSIISRTNLDINLIGKIEAVKIALVDYFKKDEDFSAVG